MRWIGLLALLCWISTAQAVTDLPILSGFDGANQETTNTDSYEFTECTQTSGATCTQTTDARVDIQKARVHDGGNENGVIDAGDASTSQWAGKSTITSGGNSGYYTMVTAFNPRPTYLAVGASFNLDTAPAANTPRTILATKESDGDYGCAISANNNRTLTLFYGGGTSGGVCTTDANCTGGQTCQGGTCRTTWGATTQTLQLRSCVGNTQLPCTAATQATDCPSGTCSASSFYWAGIELIQTITSTSQVGCDLYIDGAPAYTGILKSIAGTNPVQDILNVAIGALDGPGTPNGTITLYFDDLVLVDAGRPGFGFVTRKVPTVSGGFAQWNPQSCADRVSCVNDYDTGTFVYNASTTANLVQKNLVSKQETYTATGPAVDIPSGATVTSIDALAFGNTTTGNGLRDMQSKILLGASGQEVVGPIEVVQASGANTVPHILQRLSVDTSPIIGQTLGQLVNQMGHAVVTGTAIVDTLRVGALLEYVRVRRPDVLGVQTLLDHNKGAEDGKITVMAVGDSTLGGTAELACIGGTNQGASCAQKDYCSWDPINKSKPAGGCNATNSICKTCLLNRQFFNAGAGLACTNGAAGDCLLTCTTGFCIMADGSPTPVSCTVPADCDFGNNNGVAEAGDCDSAATCIESCPGGKCPSGRVGWADPMALSLQADQLLSCSQDGEQLSEMYTGRFGGLLDGAHASCRAVTGSGVCTCSVAGDCGAGGTCTAGKCAAGTAQRMNCVSADDCNKASGFFCAFLPPDYINVLEGYNEMNPFSFSPTVRANHPSTLVAPNCDVAGTWHMPTGCPSQGTGPFQVAGTSCAVDADCTSTSPYSVCGGYCLSGPDFGCAVPGYCSGGTTCSTNSLICGNVPGQCGAQTCVNPVATALFPTSGTGSCRCASNGQCAAGYSCVGDTGNAICRKTCVTNGDCNTTRGMSCITFAGSVGAGNKVCQGRCTLPCDAISCTSDRDCAPAGGSVVGVRYGGLVSLKWTGTCNLARGRCANCGPVLCGGNLISGPCTCASDGECGGGGVCTNNVCTTGDASRVSCQLTSDCAPDRQCLRPDAQYNAQHPYHNLPIRVARLMQDQINRLNDPTSPVIMFTPPPLPGGFVQTGTTLADYQCATPSPGFFSFSDRDFLARDRLQFLNSDWFPLQHVIDVTPIWEQNKQGIAYHADQVHYAPLGSQVIADGVLAGLQKLNVCLQPDGTPQKYCQNANGTFTSTTCSATCVSGICVRRPCNGSDANCPNANDSCGPD